MNSCLRWLLLFSRTYVYITCVCDGLRVSISTSRSLFVNCLVVIGFVYYHRQQRICLEESFYRMVVHRLKNNGHCNNQSLWSAYHKKIQSSFSKGSCLSVAVPQDLIQWPSTRKLENHFDISQSYSTRLQRSQTGFLY